MPCRLLSAKPIIEGEKSREGRGTVSKESSGSRRPRRIAIDGPGASGKSDVGSRLARRLGYRFLDTGAMYRALTWLVLERGIDPEDEDRASRLAGEVQLEVGPPPADGSELCSVQVDGQDATPFLRSPEVERAVSLVSRIPGVRTALVELQRRVASAGGGPIVMAGRDIGTMVLPDAELKVYLDASREERARRRQRQAALRGISPPLEEVLADLDRRDAIDSERGASPLRPAEDAKVINTDGLSLEEAVEKVLSLVEGS